LVLRAGVTGSNNSHGDKKNFRMGDQASLSQFFYKPVTVKRGQSALIPILHHSLEVQHVQLFSQDLRTGNLLCAVLFENSTGRTLEAGPIVFNENEIFLGESELVRMQPKDEGLISYAVELGTEITIDVNSSKLPVKRISIEKGEVKLFNHRKQRTIYTILNSNKKRMIVFLDHPFLEGWTLLQEEKETEPPVDITDKEYRFKFEVSSEEKNFIYNVRELTNDVETFNITDLTDEIIESWFTSQYISKDIRDELNNIRNLKKAANQISVSIYEKETEIRESQDHQERLRKSIGVLEATPNEAKKYIQELGREEDKLNQLYNSIKVDRGKKKALEQDSIRLAQLIKYSANTKVIENQ